MNVLLLNTKHSCNTCAHDYAYYFHCKFSNESILCTGENHIFDKLTIRTYIFFFFGEGEGSLISPIPSASIKLKNKFFLIIF